MIGLICVAVWGLSVPRFASAVHGGSFWKGALHHFKVRATRARAPPRRRHLLCCGGARRALALASPRPRRRRPPHRCFCAARRLARLKAVFASCRQVAALRAQLRLASAL
jgi:hypothetical protein